MGRFSKNIRCSIGSSAVPLGEWAGLEKTLRALLALVLLIQANGMVVVRQNHPFEGATFGG